MGDELVRVYRGLPSKPGLWHVLPRSLKASRATAICGANVYRAYRGDREIVQDGPDVQGKRCVKCTRLARAGGDAQ